MQKFVYLVELAKCCNVTLLAIVAIHTAANEPPKVRQVMNKIHRNVGLRRRFARRRARRSAPGWAGLEFMPGEAPKLAGQLAVQLAAQLACGARGQFCSSPDELSEARLRLYG